MNFLTLNGVNQYGLSQQRHYQHPGPFQLGVLSVTNYFTAAMQHPACHNRGSMAIGQGYCLPSPHVPRHCCFYVWGTLQRVCLWGSAYSGRFHQEHLPPDSSCRPQPCSPQYWSAQLEWGLGPLFRAYPSSHTALAWITQRVKSIIVAKDNCEKIVASIPSMQSLMILMVTFSEYFEIKIYKIFRNILKYTACCFW